MRILKGIIGIILSLLGLILIISVFVKKDYEVIREVTIQQPNDVVFEYVKSLRNQDKFSVWMQIDPNMKKEFRGSDGKVGFIAAWDSDDKNVGKGEQEIINIVEGERIDFELRFLEPFESTAPAYMTTTLIDSTSTLVKWGFEGRMDYPMNFMLLFMNMEEMLGNDLQEGLDKLKNLMEN